MNMKKETVIFLTARVRVQLRTNKDVTTRQAVGGNKTNENKDMDTDTEATKRMLFVHCDRPCLYM